MVAGVYVKEINYINDKPYDYFVPLQYLGDIKIGSRVLVPFGNGYRYSEGVVFELKETSEFEHLKSIKSIYSYEPLSAEMLSLATFMKNRYFSTMFDCIKVMLPPNNQNKSSRKVIIDEEKLEKEQPILNKYELRVIEEGISSGGEIDLDALDKREQTAAKYLANRGFAQIVREDSEKQNIKSERYFKLANEESAKIFIADVKNRAKQQKNVVSYLLEHKECQAKALKESLNISDAVLKALVDKQIIEIVNVRVTREGYSKEEMQLQAEGGYTLNDEQQNVYETIKTKMDEGKPTCVLLRGVTGSGKTAVFIKAIEKAINDGKTAILLVPEIALTPQMLNQFCSVFGDDVAVLHSRMSSGERIDAHQNIIDGKKKIVIGTRLGIFAPLKNIGIIIIDEEQENTYKSDKSPRYDAREISKYRVNNNNCLLLLASATPSLESNFLATQGVYTLATLDKRYNGMALPKTEIVDMTREIKRGNSSMISYLLRDEIKSRLERGEQSILFINRRGYSSVLSCKECGHTEMCEHCSIALTYHKKSRRLMCHYCGYEADTPTTCKECGSEYLKFFGSGTQKIEEELQAFFPNARIERMDTDTTTRKNAHAKILKKMRDKEIDILVGTQMVIKGLDFENVTLVGVLNADKSLYAGDYLSAQNTFNQITQVVGRCGRGDKEGVAVIQTYTPQSSVIINGANQDYEKFYESEIALRKSMNYPPFSDLISVNLEGPLEDEVVATIREIAKGIRERASADGIKISVIGPTPFDILKVNNQFRYRFIIKGENNKALRNLVRNMIASFAKSKESRLLKLYVNVNNI